MSMAAFDLKGLDILVVEDDIALLNLMTIILAKSGANVETASDGSEALKKFEQHRYQVVVTDIIMPVMNGIELVRCIRQQDSDVQIIATSANRSTDCLISAIKLGFNDYILKPLELNKLLWSVKRCSDVIAGKLRLKDEQQKFRSVVDCLGEGLCIKDHDYRITYQNRALTEIFGDFTGSRCYELIGLEKICPDCPNVLTSKDGLTHFTQLTCQSNGNAAHIECTSSLLKNSQGSVIGSVIGSVGIFRDVTEQYYNEQTIRELAFHDPLTGLPNRRLFDDRLEQAVAKSHRYQMRFGILYIDLDYFKNVNDTFGHEAGDQVLVEAGERIRSCCKRDLDTVCRQGGDEFCVIITDCGERRMLEDIAEKLLLEFRRPFKVNGAEVSVTASIGLSLFPDDGTEAKELEAASDAAMYAAKQSGRNALCSAPAAG